MTRILWLRLVGDWDGLRLVKLSQEGLAQILDGTIMARL